MGQAQGPVVQRRILGKAARMRNEGSTKQGMRTMSYGYPDGCTQAMHDRAFNPTHDDNDRQNAAQELAEGDFDKWLRGDDERGTVADYVNDHASERIRILVAGLLGNEAALERAKREAQQLRMDAVSYAAWLMDDDRIERAL